MRTKAAVAIAAGKPLEIMDVNLDGPRAGEVLVEIKATGICHTDEFTLSGADPEGLFPAILGHEGAGVVLEVGAGVTSLKPGDHVIPLYTPECRECEYCLNPKTNLCQAIRSTQGQGLMPGRHVALHHARWRSDPALHGLLDLLQPHGPARDRAGQGARRTRRSTRSATSAAASPPGSAPSSTPPRSRSAPRPSCSASAASA